MNRPTTWQSLLATALATLVLACTAEPDVAKDSGSGSAPAEAATADPRFGSWQRGQPPGGDGAEAWFELLHIGPERWSWASEKRIERSGPIIDRDESEIEISLWGSRQKIATRLAEDGSLHLSWVQQIPGSDEPEQIEASYRRLQAVPDLFDLTPLNLGPADPLDPERLQQLTAELASRTERDQEVRQIFSSGARPTREQIGEVMAVDEANTAWLREIVQELGWIDVERFGAEAATDAFLLVQHSGDLPLMLAALPLIERDVESGVLRGANFALLYDRSQLALGRHQRYGSQLVPGPDGMFVAPLEDAANVDTRRAELGMEPLAEYIDRFRSRQPGEIEIRTEF